MAERVVVPEQVTIMLWPIGWVGDIQVQRVKDVRGSLFLDQESFYV